MLKTRIITASILVPLVLVVLFQPNIYIFNGFIALFGLALLWEYASLIPLHKTSHTIMYIIAASLFCLACVFIPITFFLMMVVLHWLFAFGVLIRYASLKDALQVPLKLKLFWGIWIIAGPIVSLVYLKSQHMLGYLLCLLALVWASDIGAYFAGKTWGKRKLCVAVSPGKTWEGFFGGLAVCMILAMVFIFILKPHSHPYMLIILAILTHVMSVIGDLFESMLKRMVKVKDSGTLLPGHGGVYDRVDALTAAAPIFTLILLLLNWI